MGLVKEPLHVDFYIPSTPWTANRCFFKKQSKKFVFSEKEANFV
jgi:hypothetical protein